MEGRSADGFLTHQRVVEVYDRCIRREGTSNCTNVDGWMFVHTMHPQSLMVCREDITRMLLSLPAGARVDVSGGASVAMLTRRDDGTIWTGEMLAVERLVAMGIGVGLAEFCAPREAWPRLPGGLPYVRVNITAHGVSVN